MRYVEVKTESLLRAICKEARDRLPRCLFEPTGCKVNPVVYWYYRILLGLFKYVIKFRLGIVSRDYKKYSDDHLLTKEEVERIYAREAKTYEYKHHLTTNYRDTWWRRQSGLDIVSYINSEKKQSETIRILDIATGIGLSLEEMFRVFKVFNLRISAVGIDFSPEMLREARLITLLRMKESNLLEKGVRDLEFSRADARRLVTDEKRTDTNFRTFPENHFDCLTIIFGIGGIDNVIESLEQQLIILKPGGILSINDMHRPFFIDFKEQWPFFIGKKYAHVFGILAWEFVTRPLILRTLWGWRDPTITFYLPQFITVEAMDKKRYYSFREISLSFDNEFWWFRLPVMSTARIVLQKIEITQSEFEIRSKILSSIREVLTPTISDKLK